MQANMSRLQGVHSDPLPVYKTCIRTETQRGTADVNIFNGTSEHILHLASGMTTGNMVDSGKHASLGGSDSTFDQEVGPSAAKLTCTCSLNRRLLR
jgi:hypothetical protein